LFLFGGPFPSGRGSGFGSGSSLFFLGFFLSLPDLE